MCLIHIMTERCRFGCLTNKVLNSCSSYWKITFENYVTTPRCQQNKTRHSLLIRNTAPGFSPNTLPIFRKNKISIKNNLSAILKPVHVCWMSVTTQLGFMVRSKRYIDRIHQSRSSRTGSYSVSSALFVKPLNKNKDSHSIVKYLHKKEVHFYGTLLNKSSSVTVKLFLLLLMLFFNVFFSLYSYILCNLGCITVPINNGRKHGRTAGPTREQCLHQQLVQGSGRERGKCVLFSN